MVGSGDMARRTFRGVAFKQELSGFAGTLGGVRACSNVAASFT
jgi:hypothetical protein